MSVVIPVYDAEQFLGGTLASVRDQRLDAIEVIVVDAGSTDGSPGIAEDAARQDARFRLVRSPRRTTAPETRNIGLAEARAPFVATLDGDDQCAPDRLIRQVEALVAEPELAAVGGFLRMVNKAGVRFGPATCGASDLPDAGTEPDQGRVDSIIGIACVPLAARFVLALTCPSLSSAITYRRDALVRSGGFVESGALADDYQLLWRLSGVGGLRVLSEVVGQYRRHEAQVSSSSRAAQELEVIDLRRRIAAEVLGTAPPWGAVIAWSRRPGTPDPERFRDAAEWLDRYHDAFCAQHRPTGEDLDEISRLHRRWRSRLVADASGGAEVFPDQGRGTCQ